jgi:hypothetical protein
MNFDLNDEQQEIKRTANEFLASRFKPEKVRELAESRSYDDALWREISELGWPGIAIAEDDGGQGLAWSSSRFCSSSRDTPAPEPAARDRRRRPGDLSRRIRRSALRVASKARVGRVDRFVRWLCRRPEHDVLRPPDRRRRGDLRRDGALLAPASDVDFEPIEAIDATRSYGLVSEAAGDRRPAMPTWVATGSRSRSPRSSPDRAAHHGDGGRDRASASSSAGRSAPTRGGHRCAAMLLATEESRSLAYYAAWTADAELESLPMASAMAAARAADGGWQVPASALQVLGGIGLRGARPPVLAEARSRRRPHARHPARPSRAGRRPPGLGSGAPVPPSRGPRLRGQLRDQVGPVQVVVRRYCSINRSTPTSSSSARRSLT